MSSYDLHPPVIIDTREGLQHLHRQLQRIERLAIDTESNSLYAYREQICLIQISTHETDYVVDPLMLPSPDDVKILGSIFANPNIVKVLHAAEYDVRCLHRDFEFEFANIFDTMIAARMLRWEQVGLGSILKEKYDIKVNKRHQRADWGKRPLTKEMLHYAQLDTHFLLDLQSQMTAALQSKGYMGEVEELFDEVCLVRWTETEFDPEGFWQLKGARDLPPQSQAILRELYIYRENQAIQRDQPIFKVLSDQTLVALANQVPRSFKAMGKIKGMSGRQIRRYGAGIQKAIQRASQMPPPKRPSRNNNRPDDQVVYRYETLHTWRKEQAQARNLPSEFILSKDALWELAQVAPRTHEQLEDIHSIGPWRRSTYGDKILSLLDKLDT